MNSAAVIEAMLLRWSDSHIGRTVTLLLPDDGEHPFKGLKCGPANGQRLALSVALISDDESQQQMEVVAQPRPSVTESPSATAGGAQSRRPFTSLPLPQQAGMMCQEPTFQKFLKEKLFGIFIQYEGLGEDDQVAATMVRDFCGVQSRADLNTNNEAAIKWRGLVSDYRAYMLEPAVTG